MTLLVCSILVLLGAAGMFLLGRWFHRPPTPMAAFFAIVAYCSAGVKAVVGLTMLAFWLAGVR